MTTTDEKHKLMLLALVGLIYSFVLAYFFQGLPNARLTSDFFPRWHASRMLLTTGRSVYDWANTSEISAVTGWPKLHQLSYYYPAYLLLFTAPLALLSYPAAHVIWAMLGLWFLWSGVVLFANVAAPNLSLNRLTLLLVLLTTAIPVFQHTLYAQFNTIGLLALALSYRALYYERYFIAGLWTGGLLFKPQATLLVLLFFLLWTALNRRRWGFWPGLGAASLFLWGVAELMEPNWVISFLGTLGSYEPVQSVVDILLGNPYQVVSGLLLGVTVWLVIIHRHLPASDERFAALLAWTICLNALIVPLYGMLHIVLIGPVLVILTGGFQSDYPVLVDWWWWAIVSLFGLGLLAFILPFVLTNTPGMQIVAAEAVYRFAMPLLLGGGALWLLLGKRRIITPTSDR